MKKLAVIATAMIALGGLASADIQAPPGSQFNATRKLGRAVGNIVYGVLEIPEQIVRKTDEGADTMGYSYGLVDGTSRTLQRLGYGFYELITFTCPTFHGTYKQPYTRCGKDNRIEMNVHEGLSEFPPVLGAEGYYSHTRAQSF